MYICIALLDLMAAEEDSDDEQPPQDESMTTLHTFVAVLVTLTAVGVVWETMGGTFGFLQADTEEHTEHLDATTPPTGQKIAVENGYIPKPPYNTKADKAYMAACYPHLDLTSKKAKKEAVKKQWWLYKLEFMDKCDKYRKLYYMNKEVICPPKQFKDNDGKAYLLCNANCGVRTGTYEPPVLYSYDTRDKSGQSVQVGELTHNVVPLQTVPVDMSNRALFLARMSDPVDCFAPGGDATLLKDRSPDPQGNAALHTRVILNEGDISIELVSTHFLGLGDDGKARLRTVVYYRIPVKPSEKKWCPSTVSKTGDDKQGNPIYGTSKEKTNKHPIAAICDHGLCVLGCCIPSDPVGKQGDERYSTLERKKVSYYDTTSFTGKSLPAFDESSSGKRVLAASSLRWEHKDAVWNLYLDLSQQQDHSSDDWKCSSDVAFKAALAPDRASAAKSELLWSTPKDLKMPEGSSLALQLSSRFYCLLVVLRTVEGKHYVVGVIRHVEMKAPSSATVPAAGTTTAPAAGTTTAPLTGVDEMVALQEEADNAFFQGVEEQLEVAKNEWTKQANIAFMHGDSNMLPHHHDAVVNTSDDDLVSEFTAGTLKTQAASHLIKRVLSDRGVLDTMMADRDVSDAVSGDRSVLKRVVVKELNDVMMRGYKYGLETLQDDSTAIRYTHLSDKIRSLHKPLPPVPVTEYKQAPSTLESFETDVVSEYNAAVEAYNKRTDKNGGDMVRLTLKEAKRDSLHYRVHRPPAKYLVDRDQKTVSCSCPDKGDACSCSLDTASILIKRGEEYEVPHGGGLDIVGHHPSKVSGGVPEAYAGRLNHVNKHDKTGVLVVSLCRVAVKGDKVHVHAGTRTSDTYVHTLSSAQAGMHPRISVGDDGLQLRVGETAVTMWKLKYPPETESHKLVGVIIIGAKDKADKDDKKDPAADANQSDTPFVNRVQNLAVDSTTVCKLLDNDDEDWKQASVVGLTAGGHYKKLHLVESSSGEPLAASRFNEEREKRLKDIGLVRERVETQTSDPSDKSSAKDNINYAAVLCLMSVTAKLVWTLYDVFKDKKQTQLQGGQPVQMQQVTPVTPVTQNPMLVQMQQPVTQQT